MLNRVVKKTPRAATSASPPNFLANMGVVEAEGIAACITIIAVNIPGKPSKLLMNKMAKAGIRISRQNIRAEIVLKEKFLFAAPWAKIEPTTIRASGIVASPISLALSKMNWGGRKELIPTTNPKTKPRVALFTKFLNIAGPFACGPVKMATPKVQ